MLKLRNIWRVTNLGVNGFAQKGKEYYLPICPVELLRKKQVIQFEFVLKIQKHVSSKSKQVADYQAYIPAWLLVTIPARPHPISVAIYKRTQLLFRPVNQKNKNFFFQMFE